MNITELARTLRISPQELKDLLPQMGFNIGQRAIKVDNNTAKKIIKNWQILKHQLDVKKAALTQKLKEEDAKREKKVVFVPHALSVRDFAEISQVPVNKILAELMKNGVFASINEKIDFDTAMIIGGDLFLDVQPKVGDDETEDEKNKLVDILGKEEAIDMLERPPVIVVMGHVDHGKTKLLDSIRQANVIAGEAGGITQHIGAYQVTRKEKVLTFIDTPGHEAFTAMRSRGAKVADIAILVVAADDGVKPQTVEAFRIIEAAKIPYVVAINKIDKEDADLDRTKQELATQLNITPEDWGGKTICVPISAKEGTGIENLLDMLLLVSEAELGDSLKANPNASAAGTVVESNVDKAAGPVATILIQNGTLVLGDQLCFNGVIYGKVKALKNYKGESIISAGPSTPVKILGLKLSPAVGDILETGEGVKVKMRNMRPNASSHPVVSDNANDENIPKVNLVIKADFLGSAEAIEESLLKINTEKVKAKIISKGLGNITEGDVKRAEDSGALLVGFNIRLTPQIENLIRERGVKVKTFSVIYDLIKFVTGEMQLLIKPEINRIDEGRIKILAIFRTEPRAQIVGGKVLDGRALLDTLVEVMRGDEMIALGKLTQLQSGKQNVKEVEQDLECGLRFEGNPIIEEGDILKMYREEKIIDKL
jgi:translation initiation factor IF-2